METRKVLFQINIYMSNVSLAISRFTACANSYRSLLIVAWSILHVNQHIAHGEDLNNTTHNTLLNI